MSYPLKAWTPLILPCSLYAAITALLVFHEGAGAWSDNPTLRAMPYILLGVGFLLGLLFVQTRVSFVGGLLAIITFLVSRNGFNDSTSQFQIVIFLSTIYIPAITAVFYHSSERGLRSAHGMVRIAILASSIIILFLLPQIPMMGEKLLASDSLWFGSVNAWIELPGIGVVALLVGIVILLIRNPHESPALGPLFAWTCLFGLSALNFSAWKADLAHTVFLIYISGAATILIWTVLDSSWRTAHLDELTELPNRRALKHHLARLGGAYTLAVLDIDHFKKINDRHGHDTGDQVLRFLAAQLRNNGVGKAYRFGGEEFVIVCERREYDEAVAILDQLRKDIRSRKFGLRDNNRSHKKPETKRGSGSRSITVSVSIGIAQHSDKYDSAQEVMGAADKALYRAKKAGRNQIKTAR